MRDDLLGLVECNIPINHILPASTDTSIGEDCGDRELAAFIKNRLLKTNNALRPYPQVHTGILIESIFTTPLAAA